MARALPSDTMVTAVQRKRFRARAAVVGFVMVTIVATVADGPPLRFHSAGPDASDPAALRSLVRLAARGDDLDVTVAYELRRTVAGGQSLSVQFTSWFRATPRLVARTDASSLVADTNSAHVECRDETSDSQCVQTPAHKRGSSTAFAVFGAVQVEKSYRVNRSAARRIAGEAGQCFVVALREGFLELAALGTKLELCFATDGALLRSDLVSSQRRDIEEARQVRRGFDRSAFAQRLKRFKTQPVLTE